MRGEENADKAYSVTWTDKLEVKYKTTGNSNFYLAQKTLNKQSKNPPPNSSASYYKLGISQRHF